MHRVFLEQEDEVMGDVMLFGVLEMPESMWEDDSPLDRAQRRSRYVQAAQRIRDQDEQLAAKDAEIAELRAAIERERDVVRQSMGAIGNSVQSERHVAKMHLLAIAERDEARECVKRLQNSSQAVLDRWHAPMWQWYNQGPTAELMNDLREALAATPEHLRNA